MEWPDYIEAALPKERLNIVIKQGLEEQRFFQLEGVGSAYEHIVEEL